MNITQQFEDGAWIIVTLRGIKYFGKIITMQIDGDYRVKLYTDINIVYCTRPKNIQLADDQLQEMVAI